MIVLGHAFPPEQFGQQCTLHGGFVSPEGRFSDSCSLFREIFFPSTRCRKIFGFLIVQFLICYSHHSRASLMGWLKKKKQKTMDYVLSVLGAENLRPGTQHVRVWGGVLLVGGRQPSSCVCMWCRETESSQGSLLRSVLYTNKDCALGSHMAVEPELSA